MSSTSCVTEDIAEWVHCEELLWGFWKEISSWKSHFRGGQWIGELMKNGPTWCRCAGRTGCMDSQCRRKCTVVSVLTHTCWWSPKSMGYYRVWVLAELVPGQGTNWWTHESMGYGWDVKTTKKQVNMNLSLVALWIPFKTHPRTYYLVKKRERYELNVNYFWK